MRRRRLLRQRQRMGSLLCPRETASRFMGKSLRRKKRLARTLLRWRKRIKIPPTLRSQRKRLRRNSARCLHHANPAVFEAEAFHLLVERRAIDAELVGGRVAVPAV